MELVNLHGRIVLKVPVEVKLTDSFFCHDCGMEANFIMMEVDTHHDSWNPRKLPKPLETWIWCGNCDVGG